MLARERLDVSSTRHLPELDLLPATGARRWLGNGRPQMVYHRMGTV